jgi:glycosyltransferase involved in cell wall biosynthesis
MALSGRKIVHVTSVHRPLDVRIFEKQCKTLVERGADVVLIAVHDRTERRDGVVIQALARPRNRWMRMTRTTWQAVRAAIRQRPDLIHVHDPELLPWAALLRLLGYVTVYDMHENVPLDIRTKSWLPNLVRQPLAWFVKQSERWLLRRQPVVFAETSYGREYPFALYAVTVLNMPRLQSLPGPATLRHEPPHVGYIGAVSRDRGSVVTLEALRLLKFRGLDVGWDCVGPVWPAEHLDELHDLVRRYELSNVRFHGYVPPCDGWKIMRNCHVGLALLWPEPNFVESYPTKIFEYMAMGIPVLTSNFPLYREAVERHGVGLCVDPTSVFAVADAIETLIRDRQRARELGQHGQQCVANIFNWNVESQKLEQFYETLLPPRTR